MEYTPILERVKEYASVFMREHQASACCFHDLTHIQDVVDACREMSLHYKLSPEDNFALMSAAYFHDVGYATGGSAGHEERSAAIAQEFLSQFDLPEELLQNVRGCILATRLPQSPKNFLQELICDADLFHFGKDNFQQRNKLMHREAEQLAGSKIPKNVWREVTILLFKNHHYHTDYAKAQLSEGKQKHLEELEEQQRKYLAKTADKKTKKPDRGIETMFRVSTTNSQRLSDMADNKAHILLTVNSIILSVVVAMLVQQLDSNPHLIVPTIVLLTGVVVTMVLAILSTIPKIKNGRFTQQDVENKSVNLLFFGNFHQMPYDTYNMAMRKAMDDYDFLYSMLTQDVYSQGVVLGRKYKLLRWAYGVFMVGLIVSVIGFIIAVMWDL